MTNRFLREFYYLQRMSVVSLSVSGKSRSQLSVAETENTAANFDHVVFRVIKILRTYASQ